MKVAVAWSGGKDAALALQHLREREDCEVVELFVTAVEGGPTSLHRIRRDLVERQADAIGHPVRFVDVPRGSGNEGYVAAMGDLFEDYERHGVGGVAYGDLRLDDVRAYRESLLDGRDLDGLWPLWGTDADELSRRFLAHGFEATVVCVDDDALDPSFVGRRYDEAFLADLPDDVDPAGEDGEFHTFVHGGPPFADPVAVERGERYTRERDLDGEVVRLHYCDLLSS